LSFVFCIPSLIVSPFVVICFCFSSIVIIGFCVCGFISVVCAFCIPHMFLANSITDSCSPRHSPRNGMLFCLAIFIECILFSAPLGPKPIGTMIACFVFSFCSNSWLVYWSTSISSISSFVSWFVAACFIASMRLAYESFSSVYFPHIAIFIVCFGWFIFLM